MSGLTLSLHSEPYSPSGNLAADGFRKLLGAPSIDLVQTLVREAVQNSCDAALGDGNAEVHFRIRRLSNSQLQVLRDKVLPEIPGDAGASSLRSFLRTGGRVLEICDFGTTGLGGPTRADVAHRGDEPTDFVDFLRNVGSPRNTTHGGGTYGYGKTSLYLASRAATIIVDSQTRCDGEPVRRLIGARLGSAFEGRDVGGVRRRYTGRHWWGVLAPDGVVDPAEGAEAARTAAELGLPERDPQNSGTSIMILDPIFDGDEDEAALAMIREGLLWFFWPRLLTSTPNKRRLTFRMFHEEAEQAIPAPEEFPPLDLFARALNNLRQKDDSVIEIRSQRPKKLLGHLNIVKGLAGARLMGAGGENSLFPRRSSMIAVMRPVELVVRYYEGPPYPEDSLEWAGVFVASDEDEVEEAFAKAEPPAHDDWQPEAIPDRIQATMVRVAIREIRNAAGEVVSPAAVPVSAAGEGPSLAAAAGILGRGLVGQGREGAGPRPGRETGGGVRRKHRVSAPTFKLLREIGGKKVAIFTAIVETDGSRDNQLSLSPALAMEGGTAPRDGELEVPIIRAVRAGTRLLGQGELIQLERMGGRLDIEVEMPAECAVVLGAKLEPAGATE